MLFNDARSIEQIVWQLRLADYPRSLNRALINGLGNGAPPYTELEERRNQIEINVNDLSMTRLTHDARSQLYQGFFKPGNFFTANTDGGAASRRRERSNIVTKLITRKMKDSLAYYECMRSSFAQVVLHGIGPSNWENGDAWCPIPISVADVMMPSNTLLTFRNLPYFALYRPYSAAELYRLTRNEEAAKTAGWNLTVVKEALDWVDAQMGKMFGGTTWADYWSPEKGQSKAKQSAGIYASDLVPTIDCWDFYYWDNTGKTEGWRRRIIFDAQGGYSQWHGSQGYGAQAYSKRSGKIDNQRLPSKNLLGNDKGQFLFSSGNRVIANGMESLLSFQFADLSCVAPFKYHEVRSLGFLLYAVCHLQNRLRCKFSEAVFENLLMYMRVRSSDEAQRALKIQLASRGIVDDTVQFLSPQERWQPNPQLAELGLAEFKQIIADNSSSYVQNQNFSRDRVEKTRFQVMAEVNAMQALVSAALQQAYYYQSRQYREIFRRFMKKNSTDADVRDFRARATAAGLPEQLLVAEAWDIEPERVMGNGNKTMEMAIAQQLMEWRAAFPPESQQMILRDATLAITDDAARAELLVPFQPGITDDRHDAMVAFGALMAGGQVQLTKKQNRLDVVQVWLAELAIAVQQATQMGNMVTLDRLIGMQNVLNHAKRLIEEISQDPAQKETARQLSDAAGQLENAIKGFAQRIQQQMKAQAQGNGDGGEAAKLQAKLQAMKVEAEAKAANTRESHAQRTAQRQVQFDAEEGRREQEHQLEMRRELQKQGVEDAARLMEAASKAAGQKEKGVASE